MKTRRADAALLAPRPYHEAACQLQQPIPRLALDELAHARVGAAAAVRRACRRRAPGSRPATSRRQRVEHDHAVGHLVDRLHLVRHHDAGHRPLLPRLQDQLVDHIGHDRIEPGGRLVVEHHLGVEGQGAGQADALLHAAGQLGRLLRASTVGRQADFLQPLPDDLARSPSPAGRPGRAGRRRRCRRPTGCRTGPPPGTGSRSAAAAASARARAGRPAPGRRTATRPTVGRSRPMMQLEQHRLAAAALADDRQRLAALDVQVDGVQHPLAAELHRHLFAADQISAAGSAGQGTVVRLEAVSRSSVRHCSLQTTRSPAGQRSSYRLLRNMRQEEVERQDGDERRHERLAWPPGRRPRRRRSLWKPR